MRLRGGVVPEAGTVEYCTGGTWKAVCDSNWDSKNAFVICRQLGLPAIGKQAVVMDQTVISWFVCMYIVPYYANVHLNIMTILGAIGYQNSYFGAHPFPSITYFSCFGNETSLSNCRSSTSSSCRSDNTAGVHCRGEIITGKVI